MPSPAETTVHFLLQLGIVLAVYRLIWPVFKALGQVQVVAIMVTGFLLGPSLLGALAPGVQERLFPTEAVVAGETVAHPSFTVLYLVGQLGLVLYMFLVGSAFDTGMFLRHTRDAVSTSLAGIVPPAIFGCVVAWLMVSQGGYFTEGVTVWQAGLFLTAAIAVTAFPMLAWIIHESGLQGTRLGTIALACAAADDAVSWILLAGVVASTKGDPVLALAAFGGGVLYLVLMLTLGRRGLAAVGRWAQRRLRAGEEFPAGPFVLVVIVLLAGAWFTDLAGVYAVFGAFIVGVAMPRDRFTELMRSRLEPLVGYVLLPAFFVCSGLNTELSLIFEWRILLMAGLVLLVSSVGKGLAIALAARVQGIERNEAYALGALMNARGLMELILLNIGLQAGLVSMQLYTILVLMAIVTTFAATPLQRWFLRDRTEPGGARGGAARPGGTAPGPRERRPEADPAP
ncbi:MULTISPECIES: cation:proton antiporter [Nocardiopsis]|uniref:cation:proton antiporter n=1 Tax=Nocardiopsis TaxID=2013 RepID=UPI0003476902|nr:MULTISPECIES: cation:proton antiporter [Nocardiopsis]